MAPVSKNGKPYYTKEQYEAARYNSNALEYAQSQGYELVRQGAYYTMKEHDSMVFAPNGSWFWNSRGVHGSALEFQIYYEGKTLTEAVLTLSGERDMINQRTDNNPRKAPPSLPQQPAQDSSYSFSLPPKAANFKQLFYYLCAERGLEKTVVQEMLRQNLVYQSEVKYQGKRTMHNATFVYKDPQGNPVGAFQRGMTDQEGQAPYKRDAPGSDKRWGWVLQSPSASALEVRVFEGTIDAASDASLTVMRKGEAWRQEPVDRLSLEGLGFQPLENYLHNHPDVRTVELRLDNDDPGRRAAKDFTHRLESQGYVVSDELPPVGKDWNEWLKEVRSMEAELTQPYTDTSVPEL